MRVTMTGREQVDAYIAAAPRAARPMLRELRRIVRRAAPEAIETLSYRMPYYSHHGRLTYFAAFSKHVSLYAMGKSKKQFAEAMKPYQTSESTLRFPLGTKIPAALVTRLIRARVRELEAKLMRR
jgi:uncharacterized protein YdhG (YjbR/CyaY superfamily)